MKCQYFQRVGTAQGKHNKNVMLKKQNTNNAE